MALTNPTITAAWGKVVEDGDSFTFAPPYNGQAVLEVAPMAIDEAPSGVSGLPLIPGMREAVNRELTGPGHIYARVAPGQAATTSNAVLCAWTP